MAAVCAVSSGIIASPGLHAEAGLEARDHVCGSGVCASSSSNQLASMRVASREVEQVHSSKGDEETTDERKSIHSVRCVEALEEDEGGAKGRGGEGYVVERVDTKPCSSAQIREITAFNLHISWEAGQSLVEVVHLRQNADRCQNHEDVS